MATSSTIVPPNLKCQRLDSNDALECSLHTLPKPLIREFSHVFGDKYLNFDKNTPKTVSHDASEKELLAIPTNQKAKEDLVAVGEHIEQEKDRLLNVVRLKHFFLLCLRSLLRILPQLFLPPFFVIDKVCSIWE